MNPDASEYYDRQGEAITYEEWRDLWRDRPYRRVAEDTLILEGFSVYVSTVWLGLDHGWGDSSRPIIFETMTFPDGDAGPLDDWCQRYCTEEEAEAGHKRVVDALKEGRLREPLADT